MNLLDDVNKLIKKGNTNADSQARVCQDIILVGISKSGLGNNVTIKGGVVMRNISHNNRRTTQDIDLDFIRYSISFESIEMFFSKLYLEDGIYISQ